MRGVLVVIVFLLAFFCIPWLLLVSIRKVARRTAKPLFPSDSFLVNKLNSKAGEYGLYAILGLLSAWGFIFPCVEEESHGVAFSRGLMFLLSFGLFFERIYSKYGKDSIPKLLLHGFLYWLFYFMGALYWLVYPLTVDLSLHWVLIPFALIAIPVYLSVPLLLPLYITKKFCKNVWISAFVLVTLTSFIMYLQGNYAPGFPWALPGYVWSGDLAMMQSLSIWGIYGQTFFTLLMGGILGFVKLDFEKESYEKPFWKQKYFVSGMIMIVLIMSIDIWGYWRMEGDSQCVSRDLKDHTPYKIRCVQGSIPQKNKIDKNLSAHNLNLYLNLSQMKSEHDNWNPDFVIWPEASVPYLFTDKSKMLGEKLAGIVPNDGYLLAGAVRKDSTSGEVYNSVIVLDGFGRNIANYDKKHLVPFGEYIPFRRFIPKVFAPIANSIGDFEVGKSSNVINLKGLKIALTVCYEAIFPGEFISNDSDVDVIVNITNDAWFGHTSELGQHLNIVRARAIEEGIPLIRVTNFGISAVFDAYGRKVDFLETDEVGVIDCYIPKKIEKTFFRKFFMDKIK